MWRCIAAANGEDLVLSIVPVAIVGASGYSGAELVSLLLRHSGVAIVGLFGSGKAEKNGAGPAKLESSLGRFRGMLDVPVRASDPESIASCAPQLVFLCTPHEASLELAPALLERGMGVLDLSAAFRLKDAGAYPTFYGFEHTHHELLAQASYGLAELYREQIRSAPLTAVAGCYPTSVILPLAPLVRGGVVARDAKGTLRIPIIDATSGVSGAGRKAEQRLLFCEVSQQAYGVFKHRHQPEIDAYVGCPTIFTPHLGPYDRGILSTIHVEVADGWSEERVRELLHTSYSGEACVQVCPPGVWPSVSDVRGTNRCDIGLAFDARRGHLIISSAIDNLVKGAAGQAVQCMNIRLGMPETTALPLA
jgi:N-acetyl-gamma-glutamyl-phosphate reductase